MKVSAELVQSHLSYSAWASARLVEAARQLSQDELSRDFGTADKSVLGTLVHVFGADRAWLARLKGESPGAFLTAADYHLDVLREAWPALHERWREWSTGVTDEAVAGEVSYHDLSGRPWRDPAGLIVMHVVNHATHHRGQVSGFLRAMGHVPPKLDLGFYYREIRAGG